MALPVIKAKVTADTAGAEAGFDRVGDSATQMGNEVVKAGKRVEAMGAQMRARSTHVRRLRARRAKCSVSGWVTSPYRWARAQMQPALSPCSFRNCLVALACWARLLVLLWQSLFAAQRGCRAFLMMAGKCRRFSARYSQSCRGLRLPLQALVKSLETRRKLS